LCVAVENATADGDFLLTAIWAYNRQDLWDAHAKKWLRFEQLGGFGEVDKALALLLDGWPGPCRIFVLTDSDARYPGHETATIVKVKESCESRKVPYAILSKRMLENYLPVSSLNRLSGDQMKVFQAFLEMDNQQRSHFGMKKGFAGDGFGNAGTPAAQTMLYQSLRAPVRKVLANGFGPNIGQRFVQDRDKITDTDFRQVCEPNKDEISDILSRIEELL
jgi:hypothetical protein